MTPADSQSEWLAGLEADMRTEQRAQRQAIEELWTLPLDDRRREGSSLGPLAVTATSERVVTLRPATPAADTSDCRLREGDIVRLSRDRPAEPSGRCYFLGEDTDGIHLHFWKGSLPPMGSTGWTIDPDFFDLTGRFAAAIEALGATALGRDRILPLLMGESGSILDAADYHGTLDELEEASEAGAASWHVSQQEAIASCVAARDAFLVQGPPGTGKTRVLAEVARRLTEQGQRLLVTGPTHRAIDHALAAVRAALPPTVPVAKIGIHVLSDCPVESHESYADSELAGSDQPHVIGATPHALWGQRAGLYSAVFDSVLLDEASQLTPLLAAMAILRGEKWLFFGDDCQLPPVVLTADDTPPRERSVFGILKHRDFDCLLEESWRLNAPLAEWPSATFYGNRLAHRHDRRLALSPAPASAALAPDPALALISGSRPDATVRNEDEAQAVADLVRDLIAGGVAPGDLGIVTPFRAQAARIRRLLASSPDGSARPRVVCDTVERFQGQEREVIIVSFAAGDHAFIQRRADFLFQRERLNVAVTRARVKTIVLATRQLISSAEDLAESDHEGAVCFSSLIRHMRGLAPQ